MTTDTIRAMAFDVDGTLAGADSRVPPRTLRALASLPRAGITPIIVTGRMLPSALAILREADASGCVVACNGGLSACSTTGEVLHRAPLSQHFLDELLDASREFDLTASVFGLEAIRAADADDRSARFLAQSNPHAPVIAVGDLCTGDAFKVMFWAEEARLDAAAPLLASRFPTLERSLSEFVETSAPGANKAATLLQLLDGLGIAPDECVGFGDGGNDVSWLSEIGHPIAMGNAREEVRAVAVEIIGDHRDEAVARWIEDHV